MSGFIELLADGDAGPLTPEQMRYLEIVRRAAGRLHALVDELLERSTSGKRRRKGQDDRDRRRRPRGREAASRATARRAARTRSSSGRRTRTARTTARRSRSGCCAASREPEDALVHPARVVRRARRRPAAGRERSSSLDDVEADTIVIATGARPRAARRGARPAHARRLARAAAARRDGARRPSSIGGGFIGCEVTASLTQLGVEVTQVVREPMVFAPLQAPPLSEALHDTLPRARRRPPARGDRDPGRRARRRRHRRRAERRARAATPASRCGAASSSTSASRPAGPASTRSATSPSSTTPSSGATAASSTGRTPPTTARRSARSSPATRTRATTSSRRSSPRSSAARSGSSATRRATTTRASRATSREGARCSASSQGGHTIGAVVDRPGRGHRERAQGGDPSRRGGRCD